MDPRDYIPACRATVSDEADWVEMHGAHISRRRKTMWHMWRARAEWGARLDGWDGLRGRAASGAHPEERAATGAMSLALAGPICRVSIGVTRRR